MKPIRKLHLKKYDVVKMDIPICGRVTGGYRPYVVISPDWLNENSGLITVVPCTSTPQRGDKARCFSKFGWILAYLPQTLDINSDIEGYTLGTLSPVDSEKLERARLEA